MKRFVLGDLHGAYKALMQVIESSGINYDEDQLICLGDVADGWNEVPECFEELLKFKNLIYIIGNHDLWLRDYFQKGHTPYIWTSQGGKATMNAYKRYADMEMVKHHRELLEKALSYYTTEDNKLFVHGGFNWHQPIKEQAEYDLTWDRDLFVTACMWQGYANRELKLDKVKAYDEVFIGHTTTSRYDPNLKPVHVSNIWNLDQGAGWGGKLTLMDIDTKEYWQSDIVATLYPNEHGRG
jgi:serine/threonine protein phosphatase 1